jgi:hypothetical protein
MVANTRYYLRASVSAMRRPKPLLAPVINTTAPVLDMQHENTRWQAGT